MRKRGKVTAVLLTVLMFVSVLPGKLQAAELSKTESDITVDAETEIESVIEAESAIETESEPEIEAKIEIVSESDTEAASSVPEEQAKPQTSTSVELESNELTDNNEEADSTSKAEEGDTVPSDEDSQDEGESRGEELATAIDIANALVEIVEASEQMDKADRESVEDLQEYIAETQANYEGLSDEIKESLTEGMEQLENVSVAVDSIQEAIVQFE